MTMAPSGIQCVQLQYGHFIMILHAHIIAKLSSSPVQVQLELSTALILIISTPTPTHPHPHPRDSSNETLLDFLGR